MIRYHPYFRRTVTSVLLLVSTLSQAQTLIEADTISFDCRDSYQQRSEKDKFAISSYEEYNESGFFARREYGCLPFENIDFDTSILVGFKYRGSNCDKHIQWSTIIKKDEAYVLQFATYPRHVCRDLSFRIAWFVLSKPSKPVDIVFERLFEKLDSRE